MPTILAVRAVSPVAGTAVSLHVCVMCVTRRRPSLFGVFDVEVVPVPWRCTGVAELLEKGNDNAELHVSVTSLCEVQVLGDDAEGG